VVHSTNEVRQFVQQSQFKAQETACLTNALVLDPGEWTKESLQKHHWGWKCSDFHLSIKLKRNLSGN
jgi:hypothetical protein